MEKPFPDPHQSLRILEEGFTGHAPPVVLSSSLEEASGAGSV